MDPPKHGQKRTRNGKTEKYCTCRHFKKARNHWLGLKQFKRHAKQLHVTFSSTIPILLYNVNGIFDSPAEQVEHKGPRPDARSRDRAPLQYQVPASHSEKPVPDIAEELDAGPIPVPVHDIAEELNAGPIPVPDIAEEQNAGPRHVGPLEMYSKMQGAALELPSYSEMVGDHEDSDQLGGKVEWDSPVFEGSEYTVREQCITVLALCAKVILIDPFIDILIHSNQFIST